MAGDSDEGPEEFAKNYLSSLPSVEFYNNVEKNYDDLSKYIKPCEKIKVKGKTDDVKTICKKFLRHLEKSPLWDLPNREYDFCSLLNYWIYDKLTYIFGNKDTSDVAFGNFQLIWSYPTEYITKNIPYKTKCKYGIDVHDHEDWKKRKEFYDYCVYFNTLNRMVTIYINKCNDFYEYIKKKEELYKYFQHLCDTEEAKCPKFYNECKMFNPNILLSKLHCREEMDRKKAATEALALQLASKQKPGQDDAAHQPNLPPHAFGDDTKLSQENSDIGTKVGQSVLGVAPVLLTATALYRYTPIGSWIRKVGGTNTNGIGDMDEFSSYTQESGDMFLGDTGNYISYQPI
ncbi:PIR protein [Plasmodium ovale]|uniref:PIR protein n=1 Tax=Plasmodium ovale TaxID=36330 RepID=A0A1D3JED8_PLAOA|nr:PIR protein [Plasmodium ovale]